MNETKMRELERSLNEMAKKVLHAMPFDVEVDGGAVTASLRAEGKNIGREVVDGCIVQLVSVGLVRKIAKGRFSRYSLKSRNTSETQQALDAEADRLASIPRLSMTLPPVVIPPVQSETAVPDPKPLIERMGKLADVVRQAADSISNLALEIERMGVEIDDHMKAMTKRHAKLEQLQGLLKELS